MTSLQARGLRHPLKDRRGDLYDTPVEAVHALMRVEQLPHRIWEPACGIGNIVMALRAAGHDVVASDLNDRGCPDSLDRLDFLLPIRAVDVQAIVTNPPYQLAQKFVATALERAPTVIMLLRWAFYESQRRTPILEGCGLKRIHCFRKRLPMMHRANWTGNRTSSSIAFAWFVWDRDYTGPTMVDRISWEATDGVGTDQKSRGGDAVSLRRADQ